MDDKLFFYSGSKHTPVGRGVHEYVRDASKYQKLNAIQDWRKILSNFYLSPFFYANKEWNTVEHAFQSQKIALQSKEKAKWFHKQSGHAIGAGDGRMARKHRKIVILSSENLAIWDSTKSDVMKDILYAKFSQDEICKRTLICTMDAELWHSVRSPPIRQVELESVRTSLSSSFLSSSSSSS